MTKRYAIWNKQDDILTAVGEVFTAEQWIEKHPLAALDSITVICSAGEINGGYFGTLGQMVSRYEAEGVDFSACTTDEEKLELIEATEDVREAEAIQVAKARAEDKAANDELTATSLASIAASMEYQNLLTLEDTEVE